MTEPVFVAESARLLIAAGTGIILLLLLIIKFKIHPILSLLIWKKVRVIPCRELSC